MIPTSIDGTDITGATIDGTDVQEITVDGQTVFSAQTLPVAYSNLVAWYPFDSSFYGGSNADDVTAILGGSGDDTAYDATNNGATYQSSGGLTDINAGANSGSFSTNGSTHLATPPVKNILGSTALTMTCTFWFKPNGSGRFVGCERFNDGFLALGNSSSVDFFVGNGLGSNTLATQSVSGYTHCAFTSDSSGSEVFVDGSSVGTSGIQVELNPKNGDPDDQSLILGGDADQGSGATFQIRTAIDIDDLRFYDTVLSSSQITDIYNNTKP